MRWFRFIHKPVNVEAIRFDEFYPPDFVKRDPRAVDFCRWKFENNFGEILFIDHEDWIVKYPDGELVSMSDASFQRRFQVLP